MKLKLILKIENWKWKLEQFWQKIKNNKKLEKKKKEGFGTKMKKTSKIIKIKKIFKKK